MPAKPVTFGAVAIAVCLALAASTMQARAQATPTPEDLVGTWTGELPTQELFVLEVRLQEKTTGVFMATVASANRVEDKIPVWLDGERLRFQGVEFAVSFHGTLSKDGRLVEAFAHTGSHLTSLTLRRQPGMEPATWTGTWNALGVTGRSFPIELYVGQENGALAGYLFFRHQNLPSLWTHSYAAHADSVRFSEKNLSMEFSGRFERGASVRSSVPDESSDSSSAPTSAPAHLLRMKVTALGGEAKITFRRTTSEVLNHASRFSGDGDLAQVVVPRPPEKCVYETKAPDTTEDGWETATPASQGLDVAPLTDMVTAICRQEMTLTHGVLVARNGKLVVEEYFFGYDRNAWHDMRSASKTMTAVILGAAVDRKLLTVQRPVLSFFPPRRLENYDPRKAHITVKHLLTMSSGLDADDTRWESVASENRYQSQDEQPDWIRLALDAPMINDPGAQSLYGTANPMIAGGILAHVQDEPVESFVHRTVFAPLGIRHYKWFMDPTGTVYMGGGLHLRPRDMAKIGQMHLDGGTWQGKRVLSANWVRESMQKHGRLANTQDKNEYGYLWWHKTYEVEGHSIESIEARGNGGQYIFVIPSLETVVVITGGNYRNGRFRQPEEILERYILPALF